MYIRNYHAYFLFLRLDLLCVTWSTGQCANNWAILLPVSNGSMLVLSTFWQHWQRRQLRQNWQNWQHWQYWQHSTFVFSLTTETFYQLTLNYEGGGHVSKVRPKGHLWPLCWPANFDKNCIQDLNWRYVIHVMPSFYGV